MNYELLNYELSWYIIGLRLERIKNLSMRIQIYRVYLPLVDFSIKSDVLYNI